MTETANHLGASHTPDQDDVLVPAESWEPAPSPRLHWVLMALAGGVVAASFLLQREGSEEVAIAGIDFVLPPSCGARTLWGIDCPGCGLTRSFVSLAHGDVAASWRVNPAGIFLFAFLVFQVPYRAMQLYRIRRGLPEWHLVQPAIWFWIFLALVLLGQWLVRLPW